jgi:hypothetical protein
MTHSSIEVVATLDMDSYVDIDFPIVDNFGAIDVHTAIFRSSSIKL